MDPYQRSREAIDAAHDADPKKLPDGKAAELVYADRIEGWVKRVVPDAAPLLLLGARCQHLERWSLPRASFAMNRTGYLFWRRALYVKQAERARDILMQAGVSREEASEVSMWVSKTDLKKNPGSQALEDAACLVFLENEISDFIAHFAEYPRDKFIDIIQKTWRKMSPKAQELALAIDLPAPIAALVREAVS